jgi:hypothetical protein
VRKGIRGLAKTIWEDVDDIGCIVEGDIVSEGKRLSVEVLVMIFGGHTLTSKKDIRRRYPMVKCY